MNRRRRENPLGFIQSQGWSYRESGTQIIGETGEEEPPPFVFNEQTFWEKFSHQDQEIIRQVIQAIHSTRKRGKVADSIIQAELRWWDQQNPAHIIQGMRTYLEKGYAAQGKGEKYLRGIIRNSNEQSPGSSPPHRSQTGCCSHLTTWSSFEGYPGPYLRKSRLPFPGPSLRLSSANIQR